MTESNGGYYLPAPSYWPLTGSIALFLMLGGFAMFLHGGSSVIMIIGAVILVVMLFGWFGTVIAESQSGKYNQQVDMSFRWGMGWFIFSEVMFFAAFFGALFYVRQFSVEWIGATELLWPEYDAGWPTAGPKGPVPIAPDTITGVNQFSPMGAWGIPTINTLILLSSGATVTWAHWGLLKDNRAQLITGLFLTIALGITFLGLQAYEYIHAYTALGLTLKTGVYGATFFMLTGFHGFHVTMGTIMLIVILGRCMAGHFRSDHHFGFEAVAWYWHFVDVVWLFLFILVYWL